jgi:hypothetical protein
MAGNASIRIVRLRALIDHPRTGDGERAAAQRMLDRILSSSRLPHASGDRTYGARHHRVGRHSNLPRIAEMIREDIALARVAFTPATHRGQPAVSDPIADAPAGISYTVSTPHDSEVVIALENVPQEWGWVSEYGIETTSAALRALVDALADLMNGYNRDGLDIGTRFFGRIRVRGETLAW